jgi:hypothetical protein
MIVIPVATTAAVPITVVAPIPPVVLMSPVVRAMTDGKGGLSAHITSQNTLVSAKQTTTHVSRLF